MKLKTVQFFIYLTATPYLCECRICGAAVLTGGEGRQVHINWHKDRKEV